MREAVSQVSASYSGWRGVRMVHGGKLNRFTAEFLEGDHRFVPLFIIIHYNLLVATLTDDETCVTPAEVVHAPEGIDRKEETVHRISRVG